MLVQTNFGVRWVQRELGSKNCWSKKILRRKSPEQTKFQVPKKFGSKNLQVVIVLPRSYFCELSLCAKFDTHSTIPSLNV